MNDIDGLLVMPAQDDESEERKERQAVSICPSTHNVSQTASV